MMNIVQNTNGTLAIVVNNRQVFSGSAEDVRRVATEAMGYEPLEIDIGLAALEQNGHDKANYGVNRTFIFSSFDGKSN